MNSSRLRFTALGRRLGAASLFLPVCAGLLVQTCPLHAKPIPENLGYGLDKLVASRVAFKEARAKGVSKDVAGAFTSKGVKYADADAAALADSAITHEDGRVLVDVTLSGLKKFGKVSKLIKASVTSFETTAVDRTYRGVGIIEGYVSVDEATLLANIPGVRAVILSIKPTTDRALPGTESAPALRGAPSAGGAPVGDVVVGQTLNKIGTAFDQGVVQHRVDKINKLYDPSVSGAIDGSGISIASMSDSFDTRTAAPHAAANVTNFDLPGAANNPINTTPVNVLADFVSSIATDEGRGMVQIVHKMAPRAKLAFATGDNGEVAFANYIRTMANIPGYETTFNTSTNTTPFNGFKADVICDDISYGGEAFYGESIIGAGVDDATAVGVSYFSSAGNNIGINNYEGPLRIIPNGTGMTAAAGNTALTGTNIDLTNVPAGLYAGGFHNFNPNGQDVAQTWNLPASLANSQGTEMQWDDPYDQSVPPLGPQIYNGGGSITTFGATVTFDQTSTPPLPVFTAGQGYYVTETATSGDFDGVVSIIDPSGNTLFTQDTGTDETIQFFAPVSGQYKVVVAAYQPTTTTTTAGNFSLTVNTANATPSITSDLNLLLFRLDTGAYYAARSLTSNNIANNRPVELGLVTSPAGQTQVQFVIARGNVPAAGVRLPTRVRVAVRGNGGGGIGPAEYFTYNTANIKGHAISKGCNGTAAYSVFRPSLPESGTSPGPAVIFFDRNAKLLPVPEVRLAPLVAAADGANDSDFSTDSASDTDTLPNFFGTSAAAPHAAAIAGLVLQANGGSGKVTPAQMRSILERAAFPHDLDPSFASASVRASDGSKVAISIGSDNDTNALTGQNDPNSILVSFVGGGSLASLTFNPGGTGTTGGGVSGGINGVFDTTGANTSPTVTYFETIQPGLVFLPNNRAFTLGNSTGLTMADVTVPTVANGGLTNAAGTPTPAAVGYYTMKLLFPTGAFTGGKTLRFTIGRGLQRSSSVGGTGATTTAPGVGTTTVNPIADLFGGGVIIPNGTVLTDGMAFSGTTTSGATFQGTIKNRIGSGYSPVDGYGFINAEAAISLPIQ